MPESFGTHKESRDTLWSLRDWETTIILEWQGYKSKASNKY